MLELINTYYMDQNQPVEMAENLKSIIVGGQDLTTCRSHFDTDNNSVITASGKQIIYYSLDTCEQISRASLTYRKLKADETIVACEKLDTLLYLFTNYGHVFLWNLDTKDWSNELSLPISENETVISCKMLSRRQYIYTIKDDSTDDITIYHSMARSERERPKQREAIGNCSYGKQTSFDLGCVTSSIDLNYMNKTNRDKAAKQRVITHIKGSFIYFQQVGIGEKLHLDPSHKRIDEHHFTCVKANSHSPMIAAGDDLGRIYIYSGDYTKPNRTKLHWHSLPVNDLCFSSTGHTLFSVGGESGCVVEWDLAENNIGRKNVIPRLGMPIRLINCSENMNLLALSFNDNEIQIMETSRNSRKLKTFTKRAFDMYDATDANKKEESFQQQSIGLQWHSKTDTVVTNSRPGRLQFYSPKTRCRVQTLNFLKTDILTLERDNHVAPSDITRASFTVDGNWLAFYETRTQKDIFPDVKLHFWQRSNTTGHWGWIQTADRLHASASIVDLKFSPNSQYLVSLCEDGTFHIFHRVCLDARSNNGKPSNKQMYAKGFTGQVPQGLPAMAAFSQDSSVLAISLKNDTTLIWMIVDAYKLVYEFQLNQIHTSGDMPINDGATNENDNASGHQVLGLNFRHHEPTQSIAPLCEVRSNAVRIWNILNPQEKMEYYPEVSTDGTRDECQFTSAAFDPNGSAMNSDYFAVSARNNLIYIFRMQIDQSVNCLLSPLLVIDASPPISHHCGSNYFAHMCFLNEPIVEIDEQCLQDQGLIRLISRLCLMTSNQELIGITDKLTLERETSSNNCNQLKTVAKSDLMTYFEKSGLEYDQETKALKASHRTDSMAITEKQRRIRNRLQTQKMLKELLTRIPSHNLPEMEVLGPMILNRLI